MNNVKELDILVDDETNIDETSPSQDATNPSHIESGEDLINKQIDGQGIKKDIEEEK